MARRQRIGERKTHTVTRERGRERRLELLRAAEQLLGEREIEDIAFRDIAARAGIPEASAYHFYANRFDVFAALAGRFSSLFVAAHARSLPPVTSDWQACVKHFVDTGVRVYRRHPAARRLLIGGATPPEVKQADRRNDRAVADVMLRNLQQVLGVSASEDLRLALYHFIEITDLLFTLSVIEQGRITPAMVREATRAGVGYLAHYLDSGKARSILP